MSLQLVGLGGFSIGVIRWECEEEEVVGGGWIFSSGVGDDCGGSGDGISEEGGTED